jgi:predicted O-methyltransferase YrrM
VPRTPTRNLLEEYPDAVGMVVTLGDVTYRVSNMDPFELYCLAAIARIRNPRTIFEFGTYDGATTLWLAQTVPDAEIFTIDLPQDDRANWEKRTLVSGSADGDGVGARFKGTGYAPRITQLLGDSRTYDFSDYFGRMDLVVVDAGHSYECASSDTENALRMLSPRGAVVWDDYGWPGVVRAVDEATERHGLTAVRLVPTELVVYDRAAPPLPSSPWVPGSRDAPS